MPTLALRSDELVELARTAADIGSAAAWSDWPDSKVRQYLTIRHCSMMADEEIRARAGYGVQTQTLTCSVGEQLYPVPDRAIGGAFEKLEILPPGQTKWEQLDRVDVTGSEEYDLGSTQQGRPDRYSVRDGFVELYRAPDQAYSIRFTFYIRPSQIVQSQSSTLGGDGAVRGLLAAAGINKTARTLTVNAVPFDQLVSPPAAIPAGPCVIDVVRPGGTFALSMFSVSATLAGTTFTLDPGPSMSRVQPGDYVRAVDQTDWPMGLPAEFHIMPANRAAAEIARDIGVEEKIAALSAVVAADLERFRTTRRPQVKSQPTVIPLRPMFSR